MAARASAGTAHPEGAQLETMQVKTAAALYDIKPAYLQQLCTRGIVKSTLFGGRHYITPAEMDRVFKGIEAPKAEGKVASKKPTTVVGKPKKEVRK